MVEGADASPHKRQAKTERDDDSLAISAARRPKRLKRGYAPPETYAHLNFLHDYLKEDLDVMFCGINPGYKSATEGYHYAHPTNHFWKCLHQSGMVPQYVPPSDDHNLPKSYNLGLTNLVERPSAEAGELSNQEMKASVPQLLAKIKEYHPRIVCFVGKGMWDIVESVIKRSSNPGSKIKRGSPRNKDAAKSKDAGLKLRPYKMVHEGDHLVIKETLFFVVPSTSARVISHQLPDKIKLFADLRTCLTQVIASQIDTTDMLVVDVPAYTA
ncbi:hypothetical protein JAAARDRAFT_72403 [Jaapia argillacea MUCL 33604]|uniref:Uracil-DNA glycosylase-like domain-containing protein n=1 Tax=Jaapia argillacea MUCL 33604 TaxID=933084 RepID=A0A067PG42_9AGAM|nr:hypothetical protein JAAARDRAFT_72403 [Jaapia argillacea MUCL 33604]